MKKKLLIGICIVIALSFIACDDEEKPRQHECSLANPHDGDCVGYCPDGKGKGICTHRDIIRCEHPIKEHKGIGENCHEGVTLDEQCSCVLQSYGELFADSGIKIYRVGAVEDFAGGTPIATAVQNAKDGYENMIPEDKPGLDGKIDEIHIFPNTEGSIALFYKNDGGKLIVGIRVNNVSAATRAFLQGIAVGRTQPTGGA